MDISACEERWQESLLSHTYAKKIIQSTAFLHMPNTIAKQSFLLVRMSALQNKWCSGDTDFMQKKIVLSSDIFLYLH